MLQQNIIVHPGACPHPCSLPGCYAVLMERVTPSLKWSLSGEHLTFTTQFLVSNGRLSIKDWVCIQLVESIPTHMVRLVFKWRLGGMKEHKVSRLYSIFCSTPPWVHCEWWPRYWPKTITLEFRVSEQPFSAQQCHQISIDSPSLSPASTSINLQNIQAAVPGSFLKNSSD